MLQFMLSFPNLPLLSIYSCQTRRRWHCMVIDVLMCLAVIRALCVARLNPTRPRPVSPQRRAGIKSHAVVPFAASELNLMIDKSDFGLSPGVCAYRGWFQWSTLITVIPPTAPHSFTWHGSVTTGREPERSCRYVVLVFNVSKSSRCLCMFINMCY